MNKIQAAGIWPIIKAYSEGKVIQVLNEGRWQNVVSPSFTPDRQYRIKPAPKEFWVNEYPSGSSYPCSTKEIADRAASDASDVRLSCTHYIEVVED